MSGSLVRQGETRYVVSVGIQKKWTVCVSIPLCDVLRDPILAKADPLVLAGAADLNRPVSWVHTSEVLDIAPLLRGGELLLVGGVGLATVSPQVRRDYIRGLAAAGAAGLALETGASIPTVPD